MEKFTDQYGIEYDPKEFEDFDHGDDEVSPGGIINTPEEDWPEGWTPEQSESPKLDKEDS